MVTTSKDSDLVGCDLIDDPMLLVDPTRPAAGQFVFQRFGFADTGKRFALDLSDQVDDPESLFAVLFYPPGEVFEGSYVKFQASLGHRRTVFLRGVL